MPSKSVGILMARFFRAGGSQRKIPATPQIVIRFFLKHPAPIHHYFSPMIKFCGAGGISCIVTFEKPASRNICSYSRNV
jgi:hypothetical protein